MRACLDLLCDRQLHGLLLDWFMEGARERLANHAVPHFWQHYREAVSTAQARFGGIQSIGLQRRYQTAFFAAVDCLATYVNAQLDMLHLLEMKAWHSSTQAPLAAKRSALCDQVLTLLQALVLAQAPAHHSFGSWLTACWNRSVGDLAHMRPQTCHGVEDGEEDNERAWDEDEQGDQCDAEPMAVEAPEGKGGAEPLRTCCERLHALHWLPLVEPTLSATLHTRLYVALLRNCAGKFDVPCLHKVLAWVHQGVARWLRIVLMPKAADDEPPSAEMAQWLARLQFFVRQYATALFREPCTASSNG